MVHISGTYYIKNPGSWIAGEPGGLHARVGRNICASVNGLRISTMLSGQWQCMLERPAPVFYVLLDYLRCPSWQPKHLSSSVSNKLQIGHSIMLSEPVVVDVSEP